MVTNLIWQDVYTLWRKRVNEFGFKGIEFVEVSFNLPQFTGRAPELQWWPIDGVERERDKLLAFWASSSNAAGRTNPLSMNTGQQLTLESLWNHRSSFELQAAIVIAGYLFRLVGCSRPLGSYSEFCLGFQFQELYSLFKVAKAKLLESDKFVDWSSFSTEVLPSVPELERIDLKSIKTLVSYIAERNALMTKLYQPVRLTFD